MANKSFISRIFSKDSTDLVVKDLQDKLDTAIGETFDRGTYDVKFIEAEASTFGPGAANFSGVDQIVDVAALQKIYATETWVYGCVNAIADTVSALPIRLEKRREYTRTVYNDLVGDKEAVTHETWEPANGDKLTKLFQCPNPYTTRAEFISLICIDLLTAGDYYIYLDSDQDLSAIAIAAEHNSDPNKDDPWQRLRTALATNTHIKGMYRIPPSMIKPVADKENTGLVGYVLQTDRGNFVFDKAEIVHVRLPNPNDAFSGLSPMIPVFKSILLDRFSTEHMIRFYKSGARLGGIIHTDKALNKEQLGRFQRTFESNFTGRQNHHRTLVLPPGMEYKAVEQNPAETALLEFCRYNREAIMSAYRVPPIKLGILDNANYANARVQLKLFFTQTVKKYIDFIQDGFNTHPALLLDNRTFRIQFDLSNVEELQEDLKEKAMAAAEMLKAGATVDEVRESVWKKGPIDGGNQSPVIVEMEAKKRGAAPQLFQNLAAPQPSEQKASTIELGVGKVEAKEALPNVQADTACLSDVTPTTATFSERVSQLVAAFVAGGVPLSVAIPKAIEQARLEGFTDPDDNGGGSPKPTEEPKQAEEGKGGTGSGCHGDNCGRPSSGHKPGDRVTHHTHGEGTYIRPGNNPGESIVNFDKYSRANETTGSEGHVVADENLKPKKEEGKELGTQPGDTGANLVPTNVGSNKPKKDPCPSCGSEDCKCDEKAGGKVSFSEFLSAEIAKLGDETEVTPELFNDIKARYQALGTVKEINYSNGHTKDSVTAHWKNFQSKTDPLIIKRHAELKKFFNKYKSIVMNRFGANLKSFGMHKSRDEDDTDQILDPKAYAKLVDDYIAGIDAALKEAVETGYADTLVDFDFGPSTEEAKAALKQYGLMSAKSVDETTREQLKKMLTKMFDEGKSVTEIGVAIKDKFDEIDIGRAMTIARTETLTAVSLGKAAKRTEWQERFPEANLMKMWVTAKDDRVRDTHEELEGESVKSDEAFGNGLMYPRDPSGEASEVINCRCDVIDYAEQDEELIQQAANGTTDEE